MIAILILALLIPISLLGAWYLINLLESLANGLDKLVNVLDRLRRVIFDSQMDVIQVRKSGK